MIKFFGRGSGFSDNHNTAFFYYKKSLVLMDCSMMAFIKMKNYGLESVADGQEVERIVVAVTHTHSDHVAGIPMLIHYARFVWHVKIIVVAPGEMVKDNLRYYLNEMDGCITSSFGCIRGIDSEVSIINDVESEMESSEMLVNDAFASEGEREMGDNVPDLREDTRSVSALNVPLSTEIR